MPTKPEEMTPEKALAEARRRVAEAKATNADILDLGDLPLKQLPEFGDMPHLRVLALGRQFPVRKDGKLEWKWEYERPGFNGADIGALGKLTALTTLNLGSTAVSDISALSKLTTLTTLNLGACMSVLDISALGKLTALTTLDLSFTKFSDISVLGKLTALTKLRLPDSEAVSDISALGKLTALTTLDLGDTAISDITALGKLTALTELRLSKCQAVSDITPLGKLTTLTSLSLYRCGAVSDISVLGTLTALTTLDLGSTWVVDISMLGTLNTLTTLRLDSTLVSDITPLAKLTALTSLDVSGCPDLRQFAPLRPLLPQLNNLHVWGCPFEDLPSEACGQLAEDNVIDAVRAHFADLEKAGADDTLEVKVFVLGNGGVGKTQLCRRLRGEKYDPAVSSTHGVQLGHLDLTLDGRKVRLNLWDFGGQDIYHGTHSLFVGGPGLFLILWHPEKESGTCVEAGLTLRHRPLSYWLDYVRGLTGTQMPVLVIQSQCESPAGKRPLPVPLPTDFRYVRELQYAAADDWALPELRGMIETAVRDLLKRHPAPPIGANRARVRDVLRAELEKPVGERRRTLAQAEFKTICDEQGGVASEAELLKYLHNCGVVFHKPELFENRVIVDQSWALDAIYSLFHRRKDLQQSLCARCGYFTRVDLASVWETGEKRYTPGDQQLFLDMMQSCGVCFRVRNLGDHSHPNWVYRAPEWFPEWPDVCERVTTRLPGKRPGAHFVVRYPFLHDGILRTFLSRIGDRTGDDATFWKYGCRFYDHETQSEVIIESRQGDDPAHPGRGEVEFRAWGEEPEELVDTLLDALQQVPVGLPPEVTRPRPPVQSRRRRTEQAQSSVTPQPPANPLDLLRPGLSPDHTLEVAISYAHGDDTPKGRVRGAFVNDLEPTMSGWGYHVIRDVNELQNCGLIRQFVNRIAEIRGRVVLVLTEKYLKSVFCMVELQTLYFGSLMLPDVFTDRVVPCVLERDLDIYDDGGRQRWLAYWKEELRKKQTMDSLGPLGRDYLDQLDYLTKSVCPMLEYLANMVVATGEAALRADGFTAVKRMLERPRK